MKNKNNAFSFLAEQHHYYIKRGERCVSICSFPGFFMPQVFTEHL